MDSVFPWLTYDNLIIFGLIACGIVFVPNLIIAIYDFGIKGGLKTRDWIIGFATFTPLSAIGHPFAKYAENNTDMIQVMFPMVLLFCIGIFAIAAGITFG